ncbi:MAG: hypothetical protein QOE55_3819 [Acidobacteriaceae bacterium]|jgi:hypothetical protein|nr:hypothetical protein [Acidobacteriaceae bacterium]
MATTDVCISFRAKHDEAVNFTNATGKNCELRQVGTYWPFTDPPPFQVPVSGNKTKVKSKADLPDGEHYYTPSCCTALVQKSVTVP